jgi:hypothetical protein
MRILILLFLLLICAVIIYDLAYVPAKTYILPKVIWSYWNDHDIPKDVKLILEHRERVLHSYKHIVLYEDTLGDYIGEEPPSNYDKLTSHANKTDWMRLTLLKKYGGCWMDASIIINDAAEFDRLYEEAHRKKAELSAFYLENAIYRGDPYTYIESCFLIAPKGSPLIGKWQKEFCYAITIGFDQYRKQVIHRIKNSDKISTYLTVHATLQIVLKDSWFRPNIVLYKAEDTIFKIHLKCWKYKDKAGECIMNRILTDKTIPGNVPFIKLTNSERKTGIDISSYFE